jgi:hypothetical protein
MTTKQKNPSAKPQTAVSQQPTKSPPSRRGAKTMPLPRPQAVLQRAQADPSSLSPAEVDVLQRTIGLRAARRMLGIPSPLAVAIQAKLTVGPVGDKYEQEADRVARQVVSGLASAGSAVQRSQVSRLSPAVVTPPMQRTELDKEELQAKPNHGMEGGEVDTDVARSIESAKGSGAPLHDGVRSSMERGFGADFSGVRVHTGSQADILNRSLNARAFTTGKDIFFRSGEYSPGSSRGKELLAHELTHTVQQGVSPLQRRESPISHLEGVQRDYLSIQRHSLEDAAEEDEIVQAKRDGANPLVQRKGDEDIETKFREEYDVGQKTEALQILKKEYGLDTKPYRLWVGTRQQAHGYHGYTVGGKGESKTEPGKDREIEVIINEDYLDRQVKTPEGYNKLLHTLGHEYQHVKQRSIKGWRGNSTSEEREFLAYSWELLDAKEEKGIPYLRTEGGWVKDNIKKAVKLYGKMDGNLQEKYKKRYEKIIDITIPSPKNWERTSGCVR